MGLTIEEFWNQEPPYFLRAVVQKWARAELEAVEKEEKKRAKKEAKAAEREGVAVSPEAVALFTDAPVATKPLGGVWICEKCKAAPPRYKDYPNNYKWKTEKGFLNHKCLG